MKTVLRSKRILCLEGIRSGDIIINGEFIEDIAGYGSSKHAFDLKNLLVAPGIIDLHSDAIEKEIEPRPGAVFPEDMAVAELDKKLAAAGVTTIFHAVAVFENFEIYNRSMKTSERLIRLIHKVNKEHLSVDNRIHLRFETSSASVLPDIQKLIEENLVDMVSIMDHTPGQRQWKDIDKWNKFLHANMSDEEVKEFIDKKNMMKDKDKLLEFMKYVRKRNITTLSHDDDLNEHIDENVELGVMISEFPLTVAVAHYAKSKGISVGMGAPNVLRGGSQSGNVSAMDLCEKASAIIFALITILHQCLNQFSVLRMKRS